MIKNYLLLSLGFSSCTSLVSVTMVDILHPVHYQDDILHSSPNFSPPTSSQSIELRLNMEYSRIMQWYEKLILKRKINYHPSLKNALIKNVFRPHLYLPWNFPLCVYEEGPSLLEVLNS